MTPLTSQQFAPPGATLEPLNPPIWNGPRLPIIRITGGIIGIAVPTLTIYDMIVRVAHH